MWLVSRPAMKAETSELQERASWTLAASVHQAGIDHGTWSSRPGNPHAYRRYAAIRGPGRLGGLLLARACGGGRNWMAGWALAVALA